MSWLISNMSTWREPGGLVDDVHRAEPGQSDDDEAEGPNWGPDEV